MRALSILMMVAIVGAQVLISPPMMPAAPTFSVASPPSVEAAATEAFAPHPNTNNQILCSDGVLIGPAIEPTPPSFVPPPSA